MPQGCQVQNSSISSGENEIIVVLLSDNRIDEYTARPYAKRVDNHIPEAAECHMRIRAYAVAIASFGGR
jgi:hypothetical protein